VRSAARVRSLALRLLCVSHLQPSCSPRALAAPAPLQNQLCADWHVLPWILRAPPSVRTGSVRKLTRYAKDAKTCARALVGLAVDLLASEPDWPTDEVASFLASPSELLLLCEQCEESNITLD
jgi:hypothetical protein